MALVPFDTASADPGWNFYRDITIESDLVPSTQTNFPVLLSVTHDDFRHTGSGGSMGKDDATDIRFTDTGNTQEYDYEIEDYTSSTGALVVWIRIPSVDGSTDTSFRMWYGNAAAEDGQTVTGVWDADYMMVQHMNQTSSHVIDSTSNGNDSDVIDGTPAYLAEGQMGDAIEFDGSTDSFEIPNSASLDITGTAITFSAWIKTTDQTGYPVVLNKGEGDERYVLFVWTDVGPTEGVQYGMTSRVQDLGTAGDVVSNTDVTDDAWHYAVSTYDGSNLIIYVDGANDNSISVSTSLTTSTGKLTIGSYNTAAVLPFTGIIDEVRVSSATRSADWITTSYNNQNDQAVAAGKFINSIGTHTAATGVDPVPELSTIVLMSIGLVGLGIYLWLRRKRLVVAGTVPG